MPTSSIDGRLVIKSRKAFKQLEKAYDNRSSLSDIKPLTTEEMERDTSAVIEWLKRQPNQ